MSRRRGYCERCGVAYAWSGGTTVAADAACPGCDGRLGKTPRRWAGRTIGVDTVARYNPARERELLSGLDDEFAARRKRREAAGSDVDELCDLAAERRTRAVGSKRASDAYIGKARDRFGHDPIADVVNVRLLCLRLDVADLARIIEPDDGKAEAMRVRLSRWLSGSRPISSDVLCRVLVGAGLAVGPTAVV